MDAPGVMLNAGETPCSYTGAKRDDDLTDDEMHVSLVIISVPA